MSIYSLLFFVFTVSSFIQEQIILVISLFGVIIGAYFLFLLHSYQLAILEFLFLIAKLCIGFLLLEAALAL